MYCESAIQINLNWFSISAVREYFMNVKEKLWMRTRMQLNHSDIQSLFYITVRPMSSWIWETTQQICYIIIKSFIYIYIYYIYMAFSSWEHASKHLLFLRRKIRQQCLSFVRNSNGFDLRLLSKWRRCGFERRRWKHHFCQCESH